MKTQKLMISFTVIVALFISAKTYGQFGSDEPYEPILCDPTLTIPSPQWSSGTNKIYSPCPQVKVGIGHYNPIDNLHIATNDNEGISFVQSNSNQRSNIRFYDKNQNLNWNLTAYNDFNGGYGNIFELNSHKGGNFWVRNTTMMVGNYFDLSCSDCSNYLLFVRKGIRTERLKVDVAQGTWADYVFSSDYSLLPLKEVKSFIQEKGHLPNIPSAKTVENEGVELGEMTAKLLEKIEELTLYIIDQDEAIRDIKKQLKEMETAKN